MAVADEGANLADMARSARVAGADGLHVLIAGGGVAALEAAFALRALAGDLVDLELLTPEPHFFYLPHAVYEPFGGLRVQQFELAELAGALEAQHTLDQLASVSPLTRIVRTRNGMTIPYDVLVVACGVSPRPLLAGAVTFRGPADTDRIIAIARDAQRGDIDQLTVAIPTRRTWPLPHYELAMGLRTVTDIPITIATVEPAPAAVLGPAGSAHLAHLLASNGIKIDTNVDFRQQSLTGVTIAAPELQASRIYGLPADEDDFIPTNRFGAVAAANNVYAAGDITTYAVKHGSLAAAQADSTAEAIAAHAGAPITPTPFTPILHARIACGHESIYIRRNLNNPKDPGTVSTQPLRTPAAKIFARHLAPALAQLSHQHQRTPLHATS